LLLLSFSAFPAALTGQAPACVYADAGADQTVCTGQCASLYAGIGGTKQTNVYATYPVPYSPYSFTGGNPVLVNLDDLWSPAINIPFCFDFYGTTYNQFVIGTNGVLSFDVSQANGVCGWTINAPAPNPGLPMSSIMAPFHDINPTLPTASGATSINWNIYGTAPCRSMVINWNDVAMYGNGCDSLTSTSQIVLHEGTNIIDIFIQDKSFCTAWNNGAAIEGLQNANGTAATIVPGRNYPSMWALNNVGDRFAPAGPPNYSFQWVDQFGNPAGNSILQTVCPSQTTTYALVVNNTSCSGNPVTYIDSITVFVTPSTLSVSDSLVYPACVNSCNGSIFINPANGIPPYSYSWSPTLPPDSAVHNLCPGVYICTISDGSGCSISMNINLFAPAPFVMTATSTPTLCNDSTGSALVNIAGGTGPFTINWSNGDTTAAISTLPTGYYQVVVTDSAGCSDSSIVIVSQTGLLFNVQSTQLVCNGDCNGSGSVVPTNGVPPYTYSWFPYGGSGPVSGPLCSGTFSCVITDSTGCTSTATVNIASPAPVVVTPGANQTICLGESTIIAATVTGGTAPYTYTWSNGLPPDSSNTITPTQTTVYTIDVVDANGCTSIQQSTLVKVNNTPVPGFTSMEATCPPIAVNFTNTTDSAVYYLWDFGDPSSGANDTSTQFSPSHLYNTGGNYTVTLIAVNAYGCSDTISVPNAVQVPDAANASANASAPLLTSLDPVAIINNTSSNAVSFVVYFGDGDSLVTTSAGPYTHTYDSLGVYTVTLIAWSDEGCPDTTWLTITVEEPTTLFIPNAFTPNGDGKNDYFFPVGVNVQKVTLYIFNRWGELIFESHDMNDGWDGRYKGQRVENDVYVWRIIYEDNQNSWYEKIGKVAVVR
jgi:gliding motility-associated-like protein